MDEAEPIYSIDELAERAGVSRRTVRYYVQRGLMPAPLGVGRGKHYAETHLHALIAIKDMQQAEVSLDDIHARLHGTAPVLPAAPRDDTPHQSMWSRVKVGEGVELHVQGRRLNEAQCAAVRRALIDVLDTQGGGEDG